MLNVVLPTDTQNTFILILFRRSWATLHSHENRPYAKIQTDRSRGHPGKRVKFYSRVAFGFLKFFATHIFARIPQKRFW